MIKKSFFLLLLLLALFASGTNWFGYDSSWQVSSGFEKIPDGIKPRQELLPAGQPQIYWLGHAGFIIFWEETTILLDPNLSEHVAIIHRANKPFLSAKDLPKIDAAIISHAHYDHLDIPTLEEIPKLANIIVPQGSETFLSDIIKDKANVIGLSESQTTEIGKLTVTAVPAVHNGSRYHPFTSAYHAAGYIISNGEQSLYFAGDTGWGELFQKVKDTYAPKIAILPIGGYQPYFVLDKYHLSPADAVRAAVILGVETTIPAHFGTFRVALEPTNDALQKFAAEAAMHQLKWRVAPPFNPHLNFTAK